MAFTYCITPSYNLAHPQPSPYASVYSPHASVSAALDWFVANFLTIIGGQYPSAFRVSYPNPVAGFPYPETTYLPDLGGYYTQYDYSVELYYFYYNVYTAEYPEGLTAYIFVSYAPEESDAPTPVVDPITIQLKRDNTIAKYSVNPPDAAVLRKYDNPVKFIRANFDTTRVAVITETITGGFMIYEEASLGVATGPVYIYSSKRKLLHIVEASVIDQYRLYTF